MELNITNNNKHSLLRVPSGALVVLGGHWRNNYNITELYVYEKNLNLFKTPIRQKI